MAKEGGAMSCPECGSPFPLSHYGDCLLATARFFVPQNAQEAPVAVQQAMPAPRLQLRWTPAEPNEFRCNWACHYELVLPLREVDIRRETKDAQGNDLPKLKELVIPMQPGPCFRGSDSIPCTAQNGARFCDTPFRDGAHANWDSEALGGIPIYAVAPDGKFFKHEAIPVKTTSASK